MSSDRSSEASPPRTWLERLGQVLFREPRDQEDLIAVLRDAEQRELLDAEALAMMEGVLQVFEMRVRDIMTPRSQMVVVERSAPPEQFLQEVVESAHSRFPVIGESRDDVEGILLAKDLLAHYCLGRPANFELRDILRPAVFIPESKRLNVLLREFRSIRNHMAIVVDEYGGVAGLVTIEDVLEQIVGDIEDEYDEEEDDLIKPLPGGFYMVKALTPIDELNEVLGCVFSDAEFDTVGGLVLKGLGHLPVKGESLAMGELLFHVVRADNRRIHLLRVERQGGAYTAGPAAD